MVLLQWSFTWYEFVPKLQLVALELGKPVNVPIAHPPDVLTPEMETPIGPSPATSMPSGSAVPAGA